MNSMRQVLFHKKITTTKKRGALPQKDLQSGYKSDSTEHM